MIFQGYLLPQNYIVLCTILVKRDIFISKPITMNILAPLQNLKGFDELEINFKLLMQTDFKWVENSSLNFDTFSLKQTKKTLSENNSLLASALPHISNLVTCSKIVPRWARDNFHILGTLTYLLPLT